VSPTLDTRHCRFAPIYDPEAYPDRNGGWFSSPQVQVTLWVPDLGRASAQWGWLLGQLGYTPFQDWPDGRSWRLGNTYLVIEQSPALTASDHDRLRPGMNHLAFHAGSRHHVDNLVATAPAHGWNLLFPDTHPHAGGPDHYAAYLTSTDGYEVELVASET
jgi:catechol 2,3-dioxygenase-like lactoylglutathione lyase family enzyme